MGYIDVLDNPPFPWRGRRLGINFRVRVRNRVTPTAEKLGLYICKIWRKLGLGLKLGLSCIGYMVYLPSPGFFRIFL